MAGNFHGLPTRSLENQHVRLEYLAEAGPRIVRLSLAGSDRNLLVELPDVTLPTPSGPYSLRGGHRLWHGPEGMPRSYAPDDAGLQVTERPGGARLVQPTEHLTGIRKSIEIDLVSDRPAVKLRHQVRNDGLWPVELAPWAITMLPLGGLAILPQQTRALDAPGLLPNRHLVVWPYASWRDPRLSLADDFHLIRADSASPACKVGYLNRPGWVAYLRDQVLLVKRFSPRPAEPHADYGCNSEVYCGDQFIEVETLGPLARLEPGQTAEHEETWELYAGVSEPPTRDGVRSLVARLGLPSDT
jgi:hypothetical protein